MSELTNRSDQIIPQNSSDEETVVNLYFRDYYWKDYLYISPQRFRDNKIKKIYDIRDLMIDGEVTFRSMVNLWAKEVMRGLKQFFYEGSLHGVKYIFEPTFSRKERATWIVIMVISLAFCAVNITRLFSKWTSTPFVNVIDSLPTPIWAIPFPTVVLCPPLRLKLSYADVLKLEPLEKFFASNICPGLLKLNRAERLNATENIWFQKFINEGSLKCSDVVQNCKWPAKNISQWETKDCCEKLFRPVFTDYGLCFSLNNLPLNGMTNDTWVWHKNFSSFSPPDKLDWNLDGGYPVKNPTYLNMTPPYRVMLAGEEYGLEIEFSLNNSEHQYACDGNSSGFTVLIRSPTNHVYTSTVLRLPMNKMTTIEVSPTIYKTDPGLRALDPKQRQCFFQDERKLKYFQFYTEPNCKMDILLYKSLVQCNCSMFNWPRKAIEDPICSTKEDFECIDKIKDKVTRDQIYAYYDDLEASNPSESESISCHPSCNDVIYNSQVFYSDVVKKAAYDSSIRDHILSEESTTINVHFQDDMFLGQHRHEQYDDYYFVGAIGGLLSLFLGFSIISVAELIYFVILRPFYVIFKLNVKDKK